MASLTTSLYNAAAGLTALQTALNVSENNVTNASTPGYARQIATMEPRPFNVSAGLPGGVYAGRVETTRDDYQETVVQQRQSSSNFYNEQVSDLSSLQSIFDLTGKSGVTAALNNFFQSFSQLSVNPNDTVSRADVLNQASATANAFNQAGAGIMQSSHNIDANTSSVVDSINTLAKQIANVNTQRHDGLDGSVDAGVDAQMYTDLENLSQLSGFTVLQQSNGTLSIYLGGQVPLVMGSEAMPISADFSTPQTRIFDTDGHDVTTKIDNGQLGALLHEKNTTLPAYRSDLNTLAGTLADQVNGTLAGGVDQNGATPTTNLFSYTPGSEAYTLHVNPLTPDQLAAAVPAAPGGNGNALALSALATAKVVNGYTFTSAFGNLGERIGGDISTATENHNTQADLLTQVQNLRNTTSGVSLDKEAATLMQYEQGYSATAKMLGIVSELTNTLMGIFQPSVS